MMNNCYEEYFVKHMKRITDGEPWEIVETGRENINITKFMDDVMKHDNTGY